MSTLGNLYQMDDIKVTFGNRVKELRLKKAISQEKLAELADLDRTYIPGIEAGKRNVSLEVINKIAKAFLITVSELLLDIK